MDDALSDRPRKGRGAVSNRSGRFERLTRERSDDGWGNRGLRAADPEVEDREDALPPLATELLVDRSRRILASNESPDVPFERSINPYKGCEHGCVYCFARPTHAYLGLSAGLDFETRLFHKPDAPALLDAELRRPGYKPSTLVLGANTDPYQPVERRTRLSRRILEVLADFRHAVAVITKSALVTRDLDILGRMGEQHLAKLCISITTLDPELARRLEPRAPTPARRLAAVRAASAAGVPVAVLTAPLIPGLNDHEMEAILAAAAEAGATQASYVLLRLPLEIRELFEEWLEANAPARASRVLKLMRECRGGALYQAGFGRRMSGQGPVADLLAQRFDHACRRLGLDRRRWELDETLFRPPPRVGDQLPLW